MKRPVHESWREIEKRYGHNNASGVVELVQYFDAQPRRTSRMRRTFSRPVNREQQRGAEAGPYFASIDAGQCTGGSPGPSVGFSRGL